MTDDRKQKKIREKFLWISLRNPKYPEVDFLFFVRYPKERIPDIPSDWTKDDLYILSYDTISKIGPSVVHYPKKWSAQEKKIIEEESKSWLHKLKNRRKK